MNSSGVLGSGKEEQQVQNDTRVSVWGQGNIRGKSGSAVNRGFVWFTLCMFSPIWRNEMAAVYRGLR